MHNLAAFLEVRNVPFPLNERFPPVFQQQMPPHYSLNQGIDGQSGRD